MFPHRVHSDFSHTHPNSLMLLPLDLLPHYGNKSMLIVYMNGVTYMFIQHSNVYLMSASRQNCNVASHLLFRHRIVDVSKPAALRFLFDSKRVVIPFTSRKLCEFQGGFCCCDLYSFLQVFKHYFEELEEESLRDNFVVVVRGVLANKDKLQLITIYVNQNCA